MRGRKQVARPSLPEAYTVEIYPREGTETAFHTLPSAFPAVEIYPHEGAETIRIASLLNISDLKFIPVRGRKLIYDRVLII